jgi:hypothetical protein
VKVGKTETKTGEIASIHPLPGVSESRLMQWALCVKKAVHRRYSSRLGVGANVQYSQDWDWHEALIFPPHGIDLIYLVDGHSERWT